MPRTVDVGGGIQQAVYEQSDFPDPYKQYEQQLGLIDLQNKVKAAPLEQAIKQNTIDQFPITNEKQRVDLLSAKQDELRKQSEATLNFTQGLAALSGKNPDLAVLYANSPIGQQLIPGAAATKNEDGTLTFSMLRPNGELKTFTMGKLDALDQKERLRIESDWRKEWENDSKSFGVSNENFDNLKKNAALDTPAANISMVFSYMKTIDPNSVVQPGEQANVRNAGGVDDRVRGLYNYVLGGGRMTKEQKADLVGAAETYYQTALTSLKAQAKALNSVVESGSAGSISGRNVILPYKTGMTYEQLVGLEEVAPQDRQIKAQASPLAPTSGGQPKKLDSLIGKSLQKLGGPR